MYKPWHTFYPESVPKNIEVPSISLYQLLARTVQDYRSQLAVVDQGREWTYEELKFNVDRLASALRNLGITKGERIAVMFPNSIEYITTYFAVQRLGGIVVQVNPMFQEAELEYIIEDSGAEWFVGGVEQRPKMKVLTLSQELTCIYAGEFEQTSREYSFYQLIEKNSPFLPEIQIYSEYDLAVLQYTGGTTGKPKGVMLTHYNLIANVMQSYSFSDGFYERPGEKVLSISPFFHVYGMTSCINIPIFAAATVICMRRFEVEQTLEMIRKYKPTFFPGVPTMYIALLSHPDTRREDLESFKLLNVGSAPMPVEVMKEFERKTGAAIVEGYGLSETSPVTHRNPVRGVRKTGSIGIPIPNTDSKVIHMETGEELGVNETGELVVKGPQVMRGYWKKDEETKANLQDGWLKTGDVAYMDEDGFYYLVGRKKEMIIAGGYNVYPVEVEEILYQHLGVKEVCVFGVPDEYRGETVKAVIVLHKKETFTEEEIVSWCRKKMAAYKVPRRIEFRDSLPKTTVGKILRRKLVEEELQQSSMK